MKCINIEPGSKLDKLASAFIKAGKAYWEEVQKADIGGKTVIYIKDNTTGEFVVFTRGEYYQDLISFIEDLI